jgi:hypothetical protein
MISGLPLGPVIMPGRIICCDGLAGPCEAGRPEVLGSCPDADTMTACLTRLRGADIAACARIEICMLDLLLSGRTDRLQAVMWPRSCYGCNLLCNALYPARGVACKHVTVTLLRRDYRFSDSKPADFATFNPRADCLHSSSSYMRSRKAGAMQQASLPARSWPAFHPYWTPGQ